MSIFAVATIVAVLMVIGILVVAGSEKNNPEFATRVFLIMLILSAIPSLVGLWFYLWVASWNRGEVIGIVALVAGLIAAVIAFLSFVLAPEHRKVVVLSLMATPLVLVSLTYLVALIFNLTIVLD